MKILAFTLFSSIVGFFGSYGIVSYFNDTQQISKPPLVEVKTISEELPSIFPETPWSCSSDIECVVLAEAIYYESRGEPIEGQIAVAHVIMNRVNSPYWPDNILEVVYNNCHFSYTCDGSLERGISDFHSFEEAKILASDVISGSLDDPSNGADHYFNPAKAKFVPNWSHTYSRVATIGNHVFHKRG
jgi:spore germination cell wall hydrolase CwlJ-like protein